MRDLSSNTDYIRKSAPGPANIAYPACRNVRDMGKRPALPVSQAHEQKYVLGPAKRDEVLSDQIIESTIPWRASLWGETRKGAEFIFQPVRPGTIVWETFECLSVVLGFEIRTNIHD